MSLRIGVTDRVFTDVGAAGALVTAVCVCVCVKGASFGFVCLKFPRQKTGNSRGKAPVKTSGDNRFNIAGNPEIKKDIDLIILRFSFTRFSTFLYLSFP